MSINTEELKDLLFFIISDLLIINPGLDTSIYYDRLDKVFKNDS